MVRLPEGGEVPPPVHSVGLPNVQGLEDWLTGNPAGGLTVRAGYHRDVGGVRFSSTGGVARAKTKPPQVHAVDHTIQSADTILMSDWVFSGVLDLRIQAA